MDAVLVTGATGLHGGAVAHALSWDAYRRSVAAAALRERGATDVSADPLAWERART